MGRARADGGASRRGRSWIVRTCSVPTLTRTQLATATAAFSQESIRGMDGRSMGFEEWLLTSLNTLVSASSAATDAAIDAADAVDADPAAFAFELALAEVDGADCGPGDAVDIFFFFFFFFFLVLL